MGRMITCSRVHSHFSFTPVTEHYWTYLSDECFLVDYFYILPVLCLDKIR